MTVNVCDLRKPTNQSLSRSLANRGPAAKIEVKTSSNPRALNDQIKISGLGAHEMRVASPGYSSGYLESKHAPMLKALGSSRDPRFGDASSPVEKMDAVIKQLTGASGTLAQRYRSEGKGRFPLLTPFWAGFCDRWSYSALDPNIAAKMNAPLAYKGVRFSIADLRGLASFLGEADRGEQSEELYIKNPSAYQLLNAVEALLGPEGPGFISNVYTRRAHRLRPRQVWNQPFVATKVDVQPLSWDKQSQVARRKFGIRYLGDREIKLLDIRATYLEEASAGAQPVSGPTVATENELDDYEGKPVTESRNWKIYALCDAAGNVQNAAMSAKSDEGVEYVWVPSRKGTIPSDKEDAKVFFEKVLSGGVDLAAFDSFKAKLDALIDQKRRNPAFQLTDAQRHELLDQGQAVKEGFADGELERKLAALGADEGLRRAA